MIAPQPAPIADGADRGERVTAYAPVRLRREAPLLHLREDGSITVGHASVGIDGQRRISRRRGTLVEVPRHWLPVRENRDHTADRSDRPARAEVRVVGNEAQREIAG